MRLPRARLRTLMIAVALVGLGLGFGLAISRMNQRARVYARKAMTYRRNETNFRSVIANMESVGSDRLRAKILQLRRRAEHEAFLRDKYERAAARPWRAVPPDPPRPK